MPNWKNPEDYEFADHLTRREWAWEFLRRNKHYRAQWLELALSAADLVHDYGPLSDWPKVASLLKAEPNAWVAHPLYGTLELLPVAMGRTWHLESMFDPFSCEASDVRFLEMPFPPPVWSKAWDAPPFIGGMEEPVPVGVYTWIRLDDHLEPQLKALLKTLKQAQQDFQLVPEPPQHTKVQKDLYKGYIRALDGREAGESYHKIAEAFVEDETLKPEKYDPDQTIKDWVKAGIKRVNGGWAALLAK